jgi:hypothetical protein
MNTSPSVRSRELGGLIRKTLVSIAGETAYAKDTSREKAFIFLK